MSHFAPAEPHKRTARRQLFVEAAQRTIADLDELNELFAAWVDQVYARRGPRRCAGMASTSVAVPRR